MRTLLCGLVVLMAASGAGAAALTFEQLQDAAIKSYKARNYAAMEQPLRESLKLRPLQPRALYNLAAAEALQGHADAALADLDKLERMKLGYRPDQDADFAALKDSQKFKTLGEKFQQHSLPRGDAVVEFTGGQARFIPEGIAYDRSTDSFFLSSVHQRRILRFDSQNNRVAFVDQASHGLWSAMGMLMDDTSRMLWVATAALPVMEDFTEADRGRSGVFAFGRNTGSLRHKYLLPPDGHEHVFGDVAQEPKGGNLYVSDSAGALYYLNRDSGEYTRLSHPGELVSTQGITLSADAKRLYLSDYAQGLFWYDIAAKQLHRLSAPDDICLYGIDGLYRYQDQLIGVQNGVRPNRIVKLTLNADGSAVTKMSVLASNLPEFDEPTGGVVIRKRFYFIANSQWNRIGPDNVVPDDEDLSRPRVMRVDLDD